MEARKRDCLQLRKQNLWRSIRNSQHERHERPAKPMVADKQVAQSTLNEPERSLTSCSSQHGSGSKDPAAALSECLLSQKIAGEEMHPNVVASAPAPLKQTQTTVDNARRASLTPALTAVDNERRAPLTPVQTPVDNARHAALTPVDNTRRVAPAPADDCKRRALSSLGADLEEASRLTLLAATWELLDFLMDGNQLGCQLVVACPKQSQAAKAFASNAKKRGHGLMLCHALTSRRKE